MRAHTTAAANVLLFILVTGCAQDGSFAPNGVNTAAIDEQKAAAQMTKTDPMCATLAAEIETLNKDGITAKVSKAAAKKYKMKTADLAKADELNKVNAVFQAKCSNYPPNVTMAAPAQEADRKVAVNKVATKRKPPVPAAKPVVSSAAAPQSAQAPAPQTAQAPAPQSAQPPAPQSAEAPSAAPAQP